MSSAAATVGDAIPLPDPEPGQIVGNEQEGKGTPPPHAAGGQGNRWTVLVGLSGQGPDNMAFQATFACVELCSGNVFKALVPVAHPPCREYRPVFVSCDATLQAVVLLLSQPGMALQAESEAPTSSAWRPL